MSVTQIQLKLVFKALFGWFMVLRVGLLRGIMQFFYLVLLCTYYCRNNQIAWFPFITVGMIFKHKDTVSAATLRMLSFTGLWNEPTEAEWFSFS